MFNPDEHFREASKYDTTPDVEFYKQLWLSARQAKDAADKARVHSRNCEFLLAINLVFLLILLFR